MRYQKHDWERISQEYIEAPSRAARPSLEALAHKHGIAPGYFRKVASDGQWRRKSDEYLANLELTRDNRRLEIVLAQQERIENKFNDLVESLQEAIEAHVRQAVESGELMGAREIGTLARSLSFLQSARSPKSEVFDAIKTLADHGFLPNDRIPQIAEATERHSVDFTHKLAKVWHGDCPD